jgi:trans-aconitate methyltransferase
MRVVRAMLQVTHVGPEDRVYDLGCGDGRIVITAVKRYGARGVCVDIDSIRIKESRNNADTAGVAKRIEFRQADLFETELHGATVVTLYLLPILNERLRPKLFRELRPGTRVVSNSFDMGDWKPDSTLEVKTPGGFSSYAYYWVLPADVAGVWKVSLKDSGATAAAGGHGYQLRLEQKYQQVKGKAVANRHTLPLEEPRLHGSQLSFTIRDTSGGTARVLQFTGRVKGDQMEGEVADADGGSHPWSAARTERGTRPELNSTNAANPQ